MAVGDQPRLSLVCPCDVRRRRQVRQRRCAPCGTREKKRYQESFPDHCTLLKQGGRRVRQSEHGLNSLFGIPMAPTCGGQAPATQIVGAANRSSLPHPRRLHVADASVLFEHPLSRPTGSTAESSVRRAKTMVRMPRRVDRGSLTGLGASTGRHSVHASRRHSPCLLGGDFGPVFV